MCILLNVKKHEKTFALNVDIFKYAYYAENNMDFFGKIRYNMLHCEKAYMITREELTKNNGRK